MKEYTKWQLTKKMANYLQRNQKMSPLNTLEYIFLRDLYRYLTKQEVGSDFRLNLYNNYIKLINTCYFPNREDISKEWVEIIYKQCLILLDREMESHRTFIYLNSWNHYQKMIQVLDLIKNWSLNPLYYGYASKKEFFEDIDFLRKIFSENKIDIYSAVGKWPKKFRKRFERK
jgi:hypothetical protein